MSKIKACTKKDIAKKTAKKVDQNLQDVEQIISAALTVMREILSEADPEVKIEIRDFGVFEVTPTKAKPKARNPKTGETVYVPERRKTHFKPGQLLKKELKQPL